METSTLIANASRLLDQPVELVERLAGGRNSQVYELAASQGSRFAAKVYFAPVDQGRDRLSAEFDGLNFLWEHGERAIPQPIAADRRLGLAVFEFIDGASLPSSEITDLHIDQAVDFAVRLHELAGHPESRGLMEAAEACFSLDSIVRNVHARLQRLLDVKMVSAQGKDVQRFLEDEFVPALELAVSESRSGYEAAGLSATKDINVGQRTLSPSDFGFHNALILPDGRIVFFDFEYFGWDDPAKLIADFLLHPAMDLDRSLKLRFITRILVGLSAGTALGCRLEAVYPLFGLKWCLILLNEFLPEQLARRSFASSGPLEHSQLQVQQLEKSRKMLNQVTKECDTFKIGV